MSSGLYNEGLFREGLLRTTNLVRPGLITQFDTLEETLTRFGINGVEAALALDFIASEYRTANTSTTFAEAFTGTSPKLTYSTAAGSNSTMVNSAGEIVWAPHNLHRYGSDISSWQARNNVTASSSSGNELGDIPTTLLTATAGSGIHRIIDAALSETNPVTFSFYVKLGTFDYVQFHDGVSSNYWADFDLTGNGSVIRHTGFDATPTIEAVTSAGQTFFKITVQYTSALTTILPIISFPDPSTVVSSGTRNPTWTAAGTETLYIGGAHLYRSDLGGMHPVPGAATGFETYVPTNGNAEYLPRVGHHVYNGSTWVNEGLLIESEARTNLEINSNPATPWASVGMDYAGQTLRITGPDGVSDSMFKLQEDTSNGQHRYSRSVTVPIGTNTFSCIVKDAGDGRWVYWRTNNDGNNQWINVNPATGEVTEVGTAVSDYGVIDLGNGFYRLWLSCDSADGFSGWLLASSNTATPGNSIPSFAGTLEAGFYGGFVQIEAGPTPSSYMPTNGGTYTRTAQSLTVPPAEFGWPEPEYIGPELADGSQLDKRIGTDGTVSRAGGIISFTPAASGLSSAISEEITGLTVGKVYEFRGRARSLTAGVGLLQLRSGSGGGGSTLATSSTSFATSFADCSIIYKATGTSVHLSYLPAAGQGIEIVEASHSFREINPLSVSIQMDGRMTYADTSQYSEVWFTRWYNGGAIYLYQRLGTNSADTGRPTFDQRGISDVSGKVVSGDASAYSPGVNVPFNISSRHGSTFINGAVDGVALPGDTTPTALPDLSGTDLQIAYDFMGTIGTFRQFAGDIGDTGLVTATNPSTEPTLSLTFDGTGGSFYNLSWSE